METERKITTKDGEKAAEKLGIPFVETSAKTGHNVMEAYHELVRHIPRSGIEYKVSFDFRCPTNQLDFQRTCLKAHSHRAKVKSEEKFFFGVCRFFFFLLFLLSLGVKRLLCFVYTYRHRRRFSDLFL